MKEKWPTLLVISAIAAWVAFMGVYGDVPLGRGGEITVLKGLLTGLLLAACMVAWKATSKDKHDRRSPNYDSVDHAGWWMTLIGLIAVPIVALIAYFFFGLGR